MSTYGVPGIYREEVALGGRRTLATGVCGFVGASTWGDAYTPLPLRRYDAFRAAFGASAAGGYLAEAVEGFFENGGRLCYVVRAHLADAGWLERGLRALAPVEDIDLVCAPDSMALAAGAWTMHQRAQLEHCEAVGGRFAILDAPPDSSVARVLELRGGYDSRAGALYYPWIRDRAGRPLPPCGHVAGIYARTDADAGVFSAPANHEIIGAFDLAPPIDPAEQGALNKAGVNQLRAFPGRGIRIWGARTLAGPRHAEWIYVNVCRLFLAVGRWLERAMVGLTFEPNDLRLWVRVRRELTDYFLDLWRAGALAGQAPEQAFYVKCDAETNREAVRAAGMLVVEIGLAAVAPAEFIVVRIVQRDGHTTFA